jgi:hypothetical protein
VPNTKPSHALTDYVGEYENAAYGSLKVGLKSNELQFDFHKIVLPLSHFHYDRFDTPNDEENGKWSVNFRTNPQGDVEDAVMSLDEAETTFKRKPERLAPGLLTQLAGDYQTPTGTKIQVKYQEATGLSLVRRVAPLPLAQVKGLRFRTPQFGDVVFVRGRRRSGQGVEAARSRRRTVVSESGAVAMSVGHRQRSRHGMSDGR